LDSSGAVELAYDGSATGCLCAIAEACELGEEAAPVFVRPGGERSLFAVASHSIEASPERADRFLRDLRERSSGDVVHMVLRVLSAMPDGQEPHLYAFVQKALRHGTHILQAHADDDVAYVREWARRVGFEIHRFTGLLRFQEFKSGRLVALYEPDYEITLPLAFHFRRRLAGESWVILDCGRRHAATWNGKRLNSESPDGGLLSGCVLDRCLEGDGPSENEARSRELWRIFHRTVAIETRCNPGLQRQFMPTRYWNHLTEMDP